MQGADNEDSAPNYPPGRWSDIRFEIDPLETAEVAFSALKSGGLQALFQELLLQVQYCQNTAGDLWTNLSVLLTDRVRSLEQIETLVETGLLSLAELYVSAATISAVLGDQSQAQRLLQGVIALRRGSIESSDHILTAILSSPSPSLYARSLGTEWARGNSDLSSALSHAARLIENLRTSISAIHPDWAAAKKHAAAIMWANESCGGSSAEVFRTAAIQTGKFLKTWQGTTHRRLQLEERKDLNQILFLLNSAQLVHLKDAFGN